MAVCAVDDAGGLWGFGKPVRSALRVVGATAWLSLAGSLAAAATTPDLNGVWAPVDPPQTLHTVSGDLPPLRAKAKEIYQRHIAARAAGDVSFDSTERCLPPGTPRLLYMGPVEIVQQAKQITLLYQWNRLIRTVPMDIPQSTVPFPSFEGQSVGHWKDGVLVVDSVGFRDVTTLDAAGLPHSAALHTIERYQLSQDSQRITVRISIDDPNTYFRTWTTELTLQRANEPIAEDICLERKGIQWGGLRQTGVDRPPE